MDVRLFHAKIAAVCPIQGVDPTPPGTIWFAPNATLEQQAAAQTVLANFKPDSVSPQTLYSTAMAAGIAIISTSTPLLNATYAIDPATQILIQAEAIYITVNNAFSDGGQTLTWPDINNGAHAFPSPASFQAFASAAARYVTALQLALGAAWPCGTWVAPASGATIP